MRKVFTNGCFDVLHVGHLELLHFCKVMGDYLIVGLNSDESVRRLKGYTRPINNQEDRKKMLLALKCVDDVCIFNEDTPWDLISKLRPDVLVKGGDYDALETDVSSKRYIVGKDIVPSVLVYPYKNGYSTTGILSKI